MPQQLSQGIASTDVAPTDVAPTEVASADSVSPGFHPQTCEAVEKLTYKHCFATKAD